MYHQVLSRQFEILVDTGSQEHLLEVLEPSESILKLMETALVMSFLLNDIYKIQERLHGANHVIRDIPFYAGQIDLHEGFQIVARPLSEVSASRKISESREWGCTGHTNIV